MPVATPLCSTGVFSHDPDLASVDIVTTGMRRLPGTSFEVVFYNSWFDAAPKAADQIAAVDAPTPVVHAEKSIGPLLADPGTQARAINLFELNCTFAQAVGAEILVLHLWGLPDSDSRLDDQLVVLPRLLDIADRYGLTVSVETLLCRESTPVDVAARCLRADARTKITADTAFLAMHDQLERVIIDDRLWKSGGLNHVHLKDYVDPAAAWGAAGYLHPDEGALDLRGFLTGLQARDYSGYITLEASARHADGTPDIERIHTSLDWIATVLGQTGSRVS